MTFIPDPTKLSVGDTVYLTKERFIENYGTFTVGHKFRVSNECLRYYSQLSGALIQVEDPDRPGIWDFLKSDLSRVRPMTDKVES